MNCQNTVGLSEKRKKNVQLLKLQEYVRVVGRQIHSNVIYVKAVVIFEKAIIICKASKTAQGQM